MHPEEFANVSDVGVYVADYPTSVDYRRVALVLAAEWGIDARRLEFARYLVRRAVLHEGAVSVEL